MRAEDSPIVDLMMSEDLELARAHAATQTFGIIGLPAAILRSDHRLLAANKLMRALMPARDCHEEKRFRLADAFSDRVLSQALDDALFGGRTSVPMVANGKWAAMVAQIIVLDHAPDKIAPAWHAVIMTPVRNQELPPDNVIRGMFGLTKAETRVARMIAGGESVKKIGGVEHK